VTTPPTNLADAAAACEPPIKTNEELLRRTRENAAEMAVRAMLQRQFGNYSLDGGRGTIRSRDSASVNYRELTMAALCAADLHDGKPLRGAKSVAEASAPKPPGRDSPVVELLELAVHSDGDAGALGWRSTSVVAAQLGLKTPAASRALDRLYRADRVEATRDGRRYLYRAKPAEGGS